MAGKTLLLSSVDPLGSNDPYGPTAFTITGTKPISIDGAARGLIISGGNLIRLFAVKSGATLMLKNITLEEGKATGGTGGNRTSVAPGEVGQGWWGRL